MEFGAVAGLCDRANQVFLGIDVTHGTEMTSTGEPCLRAGTWITTDACDQEVVLRKGERFPRCPMCRRQVTWHIVKAAPGQ
jgi:hypothetical protein